MTRQMRRAFLVTLAVMSAIRVVNGQAPALTEFPAPVWNNPAASQAPGVEHRTFRSARLGKDVGYTILLPPGYQSVSRRYPVIYFLHGQNGNENSSNAVVAPVATRAMTTGVVAPLIRVWVNGPALSFYTDSPDGRIPAETVFITELIPHIDATYRTVADRTGRAIEGMSMGGFGALMLGMKHPGLFGSVVAYAPALLEVQESEDGSLTLGRAGGTHEGAPSPAERLRVENRLQFATMFGGRREVFTRNSPWGLVPERAADLRSQLPIRIVIGTADGLWNANQLFRKLLLGHGYSHEFTAVPEVGHDLPALYAAAGVEGLTFHARSGNWR